MNRIDGTEDINPPYFKTKLMDKWWAWLNNEIHLSTHIIIRSDQKNQLHFQRSQFHLLKLHILEWLDGRNSRFDTTNFKDPGDNNSPGDCHRTIYIGDLTQNERTTTLLKFVSAIQTLSVWLKTIRPLRIDLIYPTPIGEGFSKEIPSFRIHLMK